MHQRHWEQVVEEQRQENETLRSTLREIMAEASGGNDNRQEAEDALSNIIRLCAQAL